MELRELVYASYLHCSIGPADSTTTHTHFVGVIQNSHKEKQQGGWLARCTMATGLKWEESSFSVPFGAPWPMQLQHRLFAQWLLSTSLRNSACSPFHFILLYSERVSLNSLGWPLCMKPRWPQTHRIYLPLALALAPAPALPLEYWNSWCATLLPTRLFFSPPTTFLKYLSPLITYLVYPG